MVVAELMAKSKVKISISESSADESDEINSSDDDGNNVREENLRKSASSDENDDQVSSNDEEESNMDSDNESDDKVSLNDEVENNVDSDNENVDKVSSNDEIENNVDSDNEADKSGSSDDEPDVLMTNEGWADSVAKILGSSKPKNKKTLVLSRAKKHSEIVRKEKPDIPSFEVIGESDEKPEIKEEVKKEISDEPPVKKVKHEKPSIRVKPNILEKDRERLLTKIATKGVVQLFNAVRNQQKTLSRDLESNNLTEGKKEKILKKFDKRTFLDTLMGNSKSVIVDDVKKTKDEVKDEEKPKWNALRDDFMTGAKMKDWDKESIDD